MPWKLPTWKGVVGLITLVTSVITALTVSSSTLPKSFDGALAIVGAVLLAVERYADAQDYQTDTAAATVATTTNVAVPAREGPQPDPTIG